MMDLGTIEKIAHKKKRAKKVNEILDLIHKYKSIENIINN